MRETCRAHLPVLALCSQLIFSLVPTLVSGQQNVWILQKDATWVAELSQPKYEIRFEYDQRIRLRDGIELSANIWRPQAPGKFPVILMFTPYSNTAQGLNWHADVLLRARYFVPRGYVLAAINSRGRYDSNGTTYRYYNAEWRKGKFDGLDIDDSLNWLGGQPWSSGKVGMVGGSYLGFVQWLVAPLGNKYLTALVPYCSPDDDYDNVFRNGAFLLGAVVTNIGVISGRTNKPELANYFWNWETVYRHLPIRTLDDLLIGKKLQNWQDYMDHPSNDYYWRFSVGEREQVGDLRPGKYGQVKVPTLNITGWYDTTLQFTINNFMAMQRYGPRELADKHQLVIGPWVHSVGQRRVGDIDFGPDAQVELAILELRWFDHWLKGVENGITAEPPVQIFVTGRNQWRSEREWPLRRTQPTRYYFHSLGRANSAFGDGGLDSAVPDGDSFDSFVYDPADPVPSYGGNIVRFKREDNEGARDQREIEKRNDVLVYSGKPLEADTEITGRIMATLYAASSAKDTDFMVKLVDVHPNGYAQILTEGNIRARYRNSFKKEELLTPGQVYEYAIDMWSLGHVFKQGHRIRVEISSSNFPKYDRNPNTGHKFGEDTELQKAHQRVYHGRKYASHIVLPIVP